MKVFEQLPDQSCPLCDRASFEEKEAHLFCTTCCMFVCTGGVLPQFSAYSALMSVRRREAVFRAEHTFQQQKKEAENEWWHGMIFTLSLGVMSFLALGIL